LNAIVRFAEDELTCRRKPLLNYFGESTSAETCSNCDNCTSAPTPLTDLTIFAQKFLSCVKRAEEKFGAGHITDILLGSRNEKVLRWEHDKLSTYGIGTELTKKQWMHIARQLLTMGYLKQEGEYRTLSLTAKALEALRKRATIMGIMVQESEERVRKGGKRKEEIEYNNALFALLRQKRKELADEAGVPPYVIFSDRTLIEMAAYYPQSITSLLTISGVGQMKLRQYGETFLDIIKTYCEKHGFQENPKENHREKSDSSRRYVLVAEAYNAGETIQSLIERYHVSVGTIIEHLARYLAAGNRLRNGTDLESFTSATPEQQEAAFAAFEELSPTFLKPVYDRLNSTLTYDDLKILRLLYMASQQVGENGQG
jgi:ATP-dependent DNA helicase RecQ